MHANQNLQAVVEVNDVKIQVEPQQKNTVAKWCAVHWKAIFGEVLAAVLLSFFGCMSCIPIEGITDQPPLLIPLAFGLVVMFNSQIFGHISGAHMNPTVTLAYVIMGETPPVLGIFYFMAQCLGAFIGYGMLMGLSPVDLPSYDICVPLPHHALSQFQAMFIEMMLTAVLAVICCALWDPVNQDKQDSAPIKFGLTIAGLSIVGGPLTGASTNPSRALGTALWTGNWTSHWVYWAGPFLGSSIASTLYKFVFLTKVQ